VPEQVREARIQILQAGDPVGDIRPRAPKCRPWSRSNVNSRNPAHGVV
jgi:hypothetical protein